MLRFLANDCSPNGSSIRRTFSFAYFLVDESITVYIQSVGGQNGVFLRRMRHINPSTGSPWQLSELTPGTRLPLTNITLEIASVPQKAMVGDVDEYEIVDAHVALQKINDRVKAKRLNRPLVHARWVGYWKSQMDVNLDTFTDALRTAFGSFLVGTMTIFISFTLSHWIL